MSECTTTCKVSADNLAKLLADTYVLYLKTQNFHWNVVGPQFYTLHEVFEGHYNELAAAVDEIAERIRILGFRAPGSFKDFLELATLKENDKQVSANEMVAELLADHEKIACMARQYCEAADAVNDQGTVDLCGARIGVHQKTAWMLRSFLAAE